MRPLRRNEFRPPNMTEAQESYGFANQWSERLLDHGFTQISNLFLDKYSAMDPHLTHGEAMFVIHLMQHKWAADAPFPSYRLIARRMGITEASTKRYARSLEKKKYILRTRRIGETNLFNLSPLIQALDRVSAAMPPSEGRSNFSQIPQPLKSIFSPPSRAQS